MRYLIMRLAGTLALLFAMLNLLAGVVGGVAALTLLPGLIEDLSGAPELRTLAGPTALGVLVVGVCNALLLYGLGHMAWLVPHLARRVQRLESKPSP
ncbi:MAG: hypothetical protein ACK4K2_00415 [Dehalococcoidia bacterium]